MTKTTTLTLAASLLALHCLQAGAAPDNVPAPAIAPADKYSWLEEVDSPRALDWVREKNDITAKRLGALPNYASLHQEAMAALTSTSRIPEVTQRGKYLYNLWQDQEHPRGLYRRTTPEQLRSNDTVWETVLDIDALAKADGKPWAFGGATCLRPEYKRCLIELAPGGGDAAEVREFDVESKRFVAGGFVLPVAKSRLGWRDADHLYVGTDFGPGSMTDSGYPRIVKLWQRGTPLASATTLHEGKASSVSVEAHRLHMAGGGQVDLLTESPTFWTSQTSEIVDGKLRPLAIPPTAQIRDGYHGRLLLWLKEDWTFGGATYPSGAVVLADLEALRGAPGKVEMVVAPNAHAIVRGVDPTASGILVTMLDDVRGKLLRYTDGPKGWTSSVLAFPDNGTLNVQSTDDESGAAIVDFQSFLTPPHHFLAPYLTCALRFLCLNHKP